MYISKLQGIGKYHPIQVVIKNVIKIVFFRLTTILRYNLSVVTKSGRKRRLCDITQFLL